MFIKKDHSLKLSFLKVIGQISRFHDAIFPVKKVLSSVPNYLYISREFIESSANDTKIPTLWTFSENTDTMNYDTKIPTLWTFSELSSNLKNQ